MENTIKENEKEKEKEKEKEDNNSITLSEIISVKPISKSVRKDSKISENSEDNIIMHKDSEKIISDLQNKLLIMEKKYNDLKVKNENLTKDNIEKNTLMMKMSLVSLRKGFLSQRSANQLQTNSLKMAEIIKEKDDLQIINEKMLDLLTDKEIENEDLREKYKNYQLEVKLEIEKYLEKIQNLEEKVENLENSKENGGNNYDIDSLVHEYNNYKERLKRQINEYIKNEGDLREQLELKDRTIQKLNDEIQGLQLDNIQLISQSKKKDKLKESEILEIEQLKTENDKIKRELQFLGEKLTLTEENAKRESKSHYDEIIEFQKKLEDEQNYLKMYQRNKSKEIYSLKNEITKNNREISFYNKRIDLTERMLIDEKQKNTEIQNKLDKKSKELQNMNEYTKKLLSNKDNLLSQYEEEIEKISKDKIDLISQNKELLEKIKTKNDESSTGTNLADIINEDEKNNNAEDLQHYLFENKILNAEIKELKEQLATQEKVLIDLNSLEKELVKLKNENEILINNNKEINKILEEKKQKEAQALLEEKKRDLVKAITSLRRKKPDEKNQLDKIYYEKQLEALKKLKDDEKNDYEEQIKKLRLELSLVKLKNLKQQSKNDSLLNNYKNTIKLISKQYIKNYYMYIICAIVLIIAIIKFL